MNSRKGFSLTFLFLLSLLLPVASAQDVKTLFNQAMKDAQAGKIDAAIAGYKKVLELDPSHNLSLYNLSVIYLEQRKDADAVPCLLKLTNVGIYKEHSLQSLGDISLSAGNTLSALAYYRRVLELNPRSVTALRNLGNVHYALSQIDEALTYYERALKLNPLDHLTLFNLGNVYRLKGDTPRAIELYKSSVQYDPSYWKSHFSLGLSYSYVDQYDDAIAEYQKTLELNPGYPDAYYNMGNAYRFKGLYDKMVESYMKALELRPGFKEVLYNMACYHASVKGDKKTALEWVRKALALDPNLKERMRTDKDLESLRQDKEFQRLTK
jgi:superkiller protein 3